MKHLLCVVIATAFFTSSAFAQEKIKMNFNNEEITKMIENYSKATGQKFIFDSTVRGKATVLSNDELTYEEAFNTISDVLALNGFAIVKKDNVMVVRNARSAQRDGIEVYNTLPKPKPERMVTWVVTLNNIPVSSVKTQMGRLMNSSYGEIEAMPKTNQLFITDWTSSLNRISEMLKEIDQPLKPNIEKIVSKADKEQTAQRKMDVKKVEDKKETATEEKK